MPSFELDDDVDSVATDSAMQPPQHLMMLSAAALSTGATAPRTMQLRVLIQGNEFLFLVDSGSSSCFIDEQKSHTSVWITSSRTTNSSEGGRWRDSIEYSIFSLVAVGS
jgi:hypothetical protein